MDNKNNKKSKKQILIVFVMALASIILIQACAINPENKIQDSKLDSVKSVLALIKDKHGCSIINLPDLDMSKTVQISNPNNIDELISSILDSTLYTYTITKTNGQNIINIINIEEEKNNSISKDIIIDDIDKNIAAQKSSVPKSYVAQVTRSSSSTDKEYDRTSDSDPPVSVFSNPNTYVSETNTYATNSGEEKYTSDNATLQQDKNSNLTIKQHTVIDSTQQHSIYTDEIDFGAKAKPAKWTIKTNLLYDVTSTVNLGVEYLISDRYSLDIPVNWNPWTFSNNNRLKHVLIQPELRYWKNSPLSGHFFGLHLHWAFYNVGKNRFPFHIDNRYQGWLIGAGISYGYRWNLSRKFDIEASVGGGYAYLRHSKYEPEVCGPFIKQDQKHYWGITKTALNIIYKF